MTFATSSRATFCTVQLSCLLGLAAIVAGCATTRDFYEQGVKTNLAVEEYHNRVLILNVIRAYKRRPMHFTSFTKITGPAGSLSPSFGFQLPFGRDFTNNIYTFQPTIRPDTAAFEIGIFDKQDFVRGFMTPTTPKLLSYFADQGYSTSLLLHLFVRRVVFTSDDGNETTIDNEPQNAYQMDRFSTWANGAMFCELYLKPLPPDITPIDLELSDKDLPAGSALLAMQEKGYTFKKKTDAKGTVTYELTRSKVEQALDFRDRNPHQCHAVIQEKDFNARQKSQSATSEVPDTEFNKYLTTVKSARITLRSPEAMVYYLGEIVRAQVDETYGGTEKVRPVYVDFGYDPIKKKRIAHQLFNLEPGVANSLLSVEYDGMIYGIPQDRAGRSTHTISIVSQLIGLQKNATELPQSTTVRIVP